ncbi:hypothetical protein [Rhizobium sp. BE258]|jgi:hypothetical protein|uniref:hypothetical protein n=1 Tax=Rhizobium sp. BE258 TaxID=2817722 RepID=UPI00286533CD|nr:hypothetical protein [Rhizobium sp. BE258]MDR7142205.1 hypothetical protein [Rhizobium sp. BE258]
MMNSRAEIEETSRVQALVDRIIDVGQPMQRETDSVTNLAASSLFNLEALLTQQVEPALEQLSNAQLDRLRRKIEIARKLYARYESDLSRPATTEPLSAAGINQLCAIMLLAALRHHDARFLNSALKLIDGLIAPAGVQVSSELVLIAEATLDALVPLERHQL